MHVTEKRIMISDNEPGVNITITIILFNIINL